MCSRHLLCLCCGWIDLLHKYHNAQGVDIPMVKIRRSRDRFIFIKGILFLKRRLLNWNKSPIDILPVQLPHYAQYITTGHVKTRPDFDLSPLPRHSWSFCDNGPLARYAKLRAAQSDFHSLNRIAVNQFASYWQTYINLIYLTASCTASYVYVVLKRGTNATQLE